MLATAISRHVHSTGENSHESLMMDSGIGLVTFTGMSGVGKNHAAEMAEKMFGGDLVQSIVTRILRKGQDREYRKVSDDEFDALQSANRLLWWVWGTAERTKLTRDADMRDKVLRDRYGTLGEDIDRALASETPWFMHLVHDRVRQLQDYVRTWGKGKKVFSFVVVCKSEEVVHRRIIEREPGLDPKVVGQRISNFYQKQDEYLQSGLYHGLIVSRDDKTNAELREELELCLTNSIPGPRKFSL